MNAATASEIARLKTLTITQIVRQFESLFGEKCRSRNKRYLIRRIAWRLQANAEGDLSERARARTAELALDSEVRVTPPRETIQPRFVTSDVHSRPALDQRMPPLGSMLHEEYKRRPKAHKAACCSLVSLLRCTVLFYRRADQYGYYLTLIDPFSLALGGSDWIRPSLGSVVRRKLLRQEISTCRKGIHYVPTKVMHWH